MKSKKILLHLFLQLIDAEQDYRKDHSVIGNKEFLPSLIASKRIDGSYLSYAVEAVIETADLKPSETQKVLDELMKEGFQTIKQIIRVVYKHQS